jgi:glutaminyl-peptide cyclotransferase
VTLFSFWKKVAANKFRAPSIRAFCEWMGNHESHKALFIVSIKSRVPQVRGPHGQVFVRGVEVPRIWGHGNYQLWTSVVSALLLLTPHAAPAQPHFNGAKALEYARQFVAIGPRWPTSQNHLKAEAFLRAHFQHDPLEEDVFTASTPIGSVAMRNFIVRFPGKKDGAIVLATHYETNYPLRNINFVGANDGGSTTGLLLAIADQLRLATAHGKKLDGYSVWLVFFDGEEAIQSWSDSDSTYGSRHMAARWGHDGSLSKIKAFILADMIGDKDLDILQETQSTTWLVELVIKAAKKFGYERYFFKTSSAIADDHVPFVQRGVPSIDIIDLDYGPNNSYHHTAKDTMDKISANSLTIDGDVFMETIRLVNLR